MNGEKFNSDRAPKAVGLYPHARRVGNLLFLSGVGPRKAGQTDIPGVTFNLPICI
jgi:2-aminomuconate deaminase